MWSSFMHQNFKDLTFVQWRVRFPIHFHLRLKTLWTHSNVPSAYFSCLGRLRSRSIRDAGPFLHQAPLSLRLCLASSLATRYMQRPQALLRFTKDPTKLCSIMYSSSLVSFKSINYSHSSYPNENIPGSFDAACLKFLKKMLEEKNVPCHSHF